MSGLRVVVHHDSRNRSFTNLCSSLRHPLRKTDRRMKSALDYIRLASWGHEPYTRVMSSLMLAWPGKWDRGKWLQYSGWRKESFFIGVGEQQNKRHAVMQASGSLAHRMTKGFINYPEWYCTRLDVQITVPRPEWVSLPKLRKKLGKKGTSLISSQENDTLYLGARTSDCFTRLYEKMFAEMHLRLEFELKGNRSRAAWEAILAGEHCDRVFNYYLSKSRLPQKYIELFDGCEDDATERAMNKERIANAEKKLKWIESLDAAMLSAIGDHEIGERVKTLVRHWCVYGDSIDKADYMT